jgi:uncharacterized protein YjbI with pentapeptide repeats
MANDEYLAHRLKLKKGVAAWNAWRQENPDIRPDLSGADLSGANLSRADLSGANLSGADLSGANLSRADLSGANLMKANLSGANLVEADLMDADLSWARLRGADLRKVVSIAATLMKADLREANLSGANLSGANLMKANLSGANLVEADLMEANLRGANLDRSTLVETDLTDADLTGCRIYGISAWNLKLERTKQRDLVITHGGKLVSGKGYRFLLVTHGKEPEITVDNIEVAQFVYLLLHNEKIRDVIDTVTSKAVLILGRFTDERKAVLDALRDELRNRNLLPILFDFAIPASRDVTETIKTLASLARFVIADVTDATEVRAELHNIVPDFTSLPVQLILLRGHSEFVSLSHLTKFPWVLPIFEYDDEKHLLASLDKSVVGPAEDMTRKLRT